MIAKTTKDQAIFPGHLGEPKNIKVSFAHFLEISFIEAERMNLLYCTTSLLSKPSGWNGLRRQLTLMKGPRKVWPEFVKGVKSLSPQSA